MPISFPTSPANGDTHVIGSITYQYDSTDDKWTGLGITPSDRLIEGSNSLEINAGNDLIWTGDRVGVQNTSPDEALEVGAGTVAGGLKVSGQSTSVTSDGFTIDWESSSNSTRFFSEPSSGGSSALRIFTTNSGSRAEALRVTPKGQLIIHHDTNVAPDGYESKLQLADDSYQGSSTVWKRAAGSSAGANPALVIQKVRGSDVNGQGAVVDSDSIGQVRFYGADGTSPVECVNISARVDNTVSTNNVPGKLVFSTSKLLAGQGIPVYPTQAMTIKANHNVEIHDGNLVFETSGTGIDFSATTDPTSGMTSELFDNYEEGSWSPVIQNTTSAPSYSNQVGRYTRIGRVVYAQGFIQTSSTATYANGNERLFINGLPYARSSTHSVGYVAAQGSVQSQSFNFDGSNNDYSVTGQVGVGFAQSITGGETGVMFYVTSSGGIRGTVKNSANAGNSFILEFNLMYITD